MFRGLALCVSVGMLVACGEASSNDPRSTGSGGTAGAGGGDGGSGGLGGSAGEGGAGGQGGTAVPPTGGTGGAPIVCSTPRVEDRISVSMDPPSGCSTVSEGRVLDVLEPGMGAVTFVLHEGLQGGDSKSCSVTVSNLGTPVAEQLSWAKGITYAALIRPGTSGAFWLADGENWDSCSDGEQSFSVYPLVLWTGGSNPDDYYPQVFTGVDLQPDWTGPSCVRESGACQDYERGYRYSVFDDKCVVQSASAGVGEAKSLNVAGSTHNVLVRRGWQELDCPIPGDTGHTAEYPDGSWVVWANRLVL